MKKIIIYFLALSGFFTSSCSDLLNVKSETQPTYTNFFNDSKEVASLVNGLHGSFRSTFGNFAVHYRDRGIQLDEPGSAWKFVITNQLDETFELRSATLNWLNEYNIIYQANFILENIHRAPLTQEQLNFFRGQALVLKGYTQLYLAQNWGDVPLIKDSQDTGEKACTPALEVIDASIEDFIEAAKILPPANELRDEAGNLIIHKQYASRGTAYALLVKAYGWKAGYYQQPGYWDKVIHYATEVINDPSYKMAANPEEMCVITLKGDSPEGIWELCYHNKLNEYKPAGLYMAGILQKYPIEDFTTERTRRFYRVSNTRIDSMYESFDGRLAAYFYNFYEMAAKSAGITQNSAYITKWRYPAYWEDGELVGFIKTYDQNEILIRLPDIILRRAEAYAYKGAISEAIADLNTVRKRANATLFTLAEGDIFEAIQKERDKELFLESFNIHYEDVLRNRTWGKYLVGNFKTLTTQEVEDGALMLPIGFYAMEKNPLMEQNRYWKTKPAFNQ